MKKLDIEIDDIESDQLMRFCSVNNVSIEEAAALLISQKLDEWADSIIDEVQSPGDQARH